MRINRDPNALFSSWRTAIGLLAATQIVGAFLGLATAPTWMDTPPTTPYPLWIYFLQIVAFGASATILLYGGRDDRRAVDLGFTYLLAASAFTYRPILLFRELLPESIQVLATLLAGLPATAFLPYFMWSFFREFPRIALTQKAQRWQRGCVGFCLFAGAGFFISDTVLAVMDSVGADDRTHPVFLLLSNRGAAHNAFWVFMYSMLFLALLVAVWKAGKAPQEEKRRVAFFVGGLTLGCGPILVEGLLEMLIPGFREVMDQRTPQIIAGFVVYPLLLSVPMTTSYSVLVDRVLGIRPILRKAVRYALARYTVLIMASVPVICFAVYVYVHIDEPVLRLFAGPGLLILISTGLAGVLVMRLRRHVLDFLDRHFFREAYDAKAIVLGLVERTRAVQSARELGHLLTSEIDRALHLTDATFLAIDNSTGYLVSTDPKHRPLSVTSALATRLAEDSGALEVRDQSHPSVQRLPLEDRQWITDGKFCLLVPLLGSDGTFIGAIALGEKKSELPFSQEDRSLLGAIAASGALALENRLSHLQNNGNGDSVAILNKDGSDATAEVDSEVATQCPRCWRLQKPRDVACGQCGHRLVKASVPYVLQGKFRIEERVGAGAMGIVYRAVDLDLGRTVAIKTLPSMSLKYSLQLRREARVMAAVQHPNLAMIHGAETWRGTPLLVFEYLDGGTLLERIRHAPLGVDETIQIGLVLVDVLDQIHKAGILHRDIKPSNIGYTRDNQAKLMDFGLAHIIFESRRQGNSARVLESPLLPAGDERDTDSESENTWTRRLVGTPLYMSPEAVRCEPPGPCFDLWSLSIVLYEALVGRNPLQGDNVRETLSHIVNRDVPDIREWRRDVNEPVARFFQLALSRNKSRRPQDAPEMKTWLERVRAEVANKGNVSPHPNFGKRIALGHGS